VLPFELHLRCAWKTKKWVMQVKNDAPAEFCSVVFHNIQVPPLT
jgi:hypothetical protein